MKKFIILLVCLIGFATQSFSLKYKVENNKHNTCVHVESFWWNNGMFIDIEFEDVYVKCIENLGYKLKSKTEVLYWETLHSKMFIKPKLKEALNNSEIGFTKEQIEILLEEAAQMEANCFIIDDKGVSDKYGMTVTKYKPDGKDYSLGLIGGGRQVFTVKYYEFEDYPQNKGKHDLKKIDLYNCLLNGPNK